MSVETGPARSTTSQKVFICYRRDETSAHAGRIYDAMVSRFGVDNVFMDLDLAPGIDFVDRITKVVSGCVVLIVVIGPRWAQLQDEDGTRRIEDPDDFVRLEIETGLGRNDVTPIPVLVGGARMPRREDLPPELQAITRRNALELSEGRWRYDVGRLLTTLDELLPGAAEPTPPAPPPEPPRPALGWRLVFEGMLLAGLAAVAGRLLGEVVYNASEKDWRWRQLLEGNTVDDEESSTEVLEHITEIVTRRTVTVALVGGALAIWLTWRVRRTEPLRHLPRGLLVGALAGFLAGVIFGMAVYLPGKTVPLDARLEIDLLSTAVSGGVLGWLIGWLWRPPRVGAAVLAGAAGGFLFQLVVVITGWQGGGTSSAVLKFALGSAAITGAALAALVAANHHESRQLGAAGD